MKVITGILLNFLCDVINSTASVYLNALYMILKAQLVYI